MPLRAKRGCKLMSNDGGKAPLRVPFGAVRRDCRLPVVGGKAPLAAMGDEGRLAIAGCRSPKNRNVGIRYLSIKFCQHFLAICWRFIALSAIMPTNSSFSASKWAFYCILFKKCWQNHALMLFLPTSYVSQPMRPARHIAHLSCPAFCRGYSSSPLM